MSINSMVQPRRASGSRQTFFGDSNSPPSPNKRGHTTHFRYSELSRHLV